MAALEDLIPGVILKGILPQSLVTLLSVRHHGSIGAELVYQDTSGKTNAILLYRENMADVEVMPPDPLWSFTADGALFRLISEAYRISLAYLFDPLLAVHMSLVEPLPHQITAVYETMLNKQPLRYLLADDPGAGKTIMTGLLIRELMLRGDVRRCLIVAPGNLVEQWQDELHQRFHVTFELLTNARLETAAPGPAFDEIPLCIARLDKLARDTHLQELLAQSEWDLIVVDEAHKMSASFQGGEVKYTKRYQLGEQLGRITRHLLLLTATPHNGKEEDFQLFMRLLDADRFEGKFRDGVHKVDVSDLMRHLVKEQLYKFDGTPLFPERLAYTANYQLSGLEETLYHEVTDYVSEEFNRADALENHGRKGTVGFALTTLQRRLASSPEAIYQSLKRRRERLERRAQEVQTARENQDTPAHLWSDALALPTLSAEDLDDLDDAPGSELEEIEERLVDQASAARTLAELEVEISMLARLEALALQVRRGGTDRKWEELASLLHRRTMFDAHGQRFKLVIFTEHRDTLNYLAERIRTMLGQPEAVVTIHGGLSREERSKAQTAFTHDAATAILIATDAAGEGINLQRAHLMVNYDLPWNPNRIEQRFGRIHRIGQTEVCHLWNLVANETREGAVFHTLLKKLEAERDALGGQVFNVLGKVRFNNRPLRDLMVEAIRYGERPDVRSRLSQVVADALDHSHLQDLLEDRALAHEIMDVARVFRVRADMERAAARRLQPHFIASFFLAAFKQLGGICYEREAQRYEITHVPQTIRTRGGRAHGRAPILRQYERVVFEKARIQQAEQPPAALLCPGHPLLDATLEILLEQHRDLLTQGALLVDPTDQSENLRVLFYLEHTIQDASHNAHGQRREVSRQLQFVELNAAGELASAGYAPFLDYRPLQPDEYAFVAHLRATPWLKRNLEEEARSYAIRELVPRHLHEVRQRREQQIDKTSAAVNERLTREISYWDNRAVSLKAQAARGKPNALVNAQQARQRAEELNTRRERRLSDLEQERKLSPLPPLVVGGVLIVPQGLLDRLTRETASNVPDAFAHETKRVELLAMQAVMQIERQLGYIPRDVSADKCGYDIESAMPASGQLRFIEVKGRVKDARTVIVTKNEILTALNRPDDFILALVEVDGEQTSTRYVMRPFKREPDFGATSVTYDLALLLHKGVAPV